MMFPGYMPDYMSWMMLGSYLFWTLLAVLVVYAVARLARPADHRGNAKAILDERLARGEIDPEEYHSRLTLLGN